VIIIVIIIFTHSVGKLVGYFSKNSSVLVVYVLSHYVVLTKFHFFSFGDYISGILGLLHYRVSA